MSGVRRLCRWSGPPGMVDVMIAAATTVVVIAGTAWAESQGPDASPAHPAGPVGYLLVALGALALVFRNAAVLPTFAVTLGLGIAYQAAGFPGGPDPLPVVIALYTIAARGGRQLALGLGLAATVALVGVRGLAVPDGFASPLIIAFPTTVVAALFLGQLAATHRMRSLVAAQQALAAEHAREADTRRRVDAERLRIARELHDVVAHNISLINVQATMGVHLIDERPDEAAAALAAIKQASKQALRELRRILDVLRQPDEVEPTAPAPGLAQLDAMLASTTHAGLPTRLRIVGEPHDLPPTVDVAAFRIIQESLTNALRYAAPADTRVTLHYNTASLIVDVTDDGRNGPPPPPGTGHGIAGMRERAAAVGGTLDAGPTEHGGFTVRADLPTTAATP